MEWYIEVEINMDEIQKHNVESKKQMACSHFFKVRKQGKLNNVYMHTYIFGKRNLKKQAY